MIAAIRKLINISVIEADQLCSFSTIRKFQRKETVSRPGSHADSVFFIIEGILRVTVTDLDGNEHTIHFASENQFICDYSSFLEQKQSSYRLETIEPVKAVELPRKAIEWGYSNLSEGEKFGRLIAEFYFLYLDNRIKTLYTQTPRERYNGITKVFPNIHNRVPQHMIASYLGITPVHLSRLKNEK